MSMPSVGAGATDQQINDYVRLNYPQVAWALSDPDLGGILREAAVNGWDASKLTGAIEGTSWWQTHSASVRQWQQQMAEDPATANTKISQRQLQFSLQAKSLGLNIDDGTLKDLATQSLQFGWTDQETRTHLAEFFNTAHLTTAAGANGTPTVQGDFGAALTHIKDLASQWMVPLSDDTMKKWATDMFTGAADESGFTQYLQTMFQSRFPTVQLQGGTTPTQYFDPYRQLIAKTLEIPSTQVDLLNNGTYARMLDYVPAGETQARPMTLTESDRYLRTLPQWQYTQNAHEDTDHLVTNLAKGFGVTA